MNTDKSFRPWLALLLPLITHCGDPQVKEVRLEHVQGGVSVCADVVCDAPDLCQQPGVCNPDTGECEYADVNDGTPCDDQDACTYGEVCQAGRCGAGEDVVCRASDPCSQDGVCDKERGCIFEAAPNGTQCQDGDPCTEGDSCQAGVCVGTTKDCAAMAESECMVGACSSATGECEVLPMPDGSTCSVASDGTEAGACDILGCLAGSCVVQPKVCVPIDDCHGAGECDPTSGECSTPNLPNGTECSDGDVCSENEQCTDGVCGGGTAVVCPDTGNQCLNAGECVPGVGCVPVLAQDGSSCNDENACTRTDTCQAGECVGANEVDCSSANPCVNDGVCAPSTGQCVPGTKRPDGARCDDNDACVVGTTCENGVCGGGSPLECPVRNQCEETPRCDSNVGCVYVAKANDTPCSDGDGCTTGDRCVQGQCESVDTVDCSGLNSDCAVGVCNTATGECAAAPKPDETPCDDGLSCSPTGDKCIAGVCVGGRRSVCPPQECIRNPVCIDLEGGDTTCGGEFEPNGTPCTLERNDPCSEAASCQGGLCKSTTEKVCPAINGCHTAGVCDPATEAGDCTAPLAADPGDVATISFVDRSKKRGDGDLGLDWETLPKGAFTANSNAAALLDYDLDGLTDVVMITDDGLLLLRNQLFFFEDRTSEAQLTGFTDINAVVAADYDNDGDSDLLVLTASEDGSVLLRNREDDGVRKLTRVPNSGLEGSGVPQAADFGDFDGDGDLDVVVARSGPNLENPQAGASNVLYRNAGPVSYRFTAEAVTLGSANTRDILFSDVDGDRDLDILECNDGRNGGAGNALWLNNGGAYSLAASSQGFTRDAVCTALSTGDFDRDGDVDLYVSFAGDNQLLRRGTSYTDVTNSVTDVDREVCSPGVETTSWGSGFRDFDLDGFPDIFVTNGPRVGSGISNNALLRGGDGGTFSDESAPSGASDSRIGRDALFFDYDADGDDDIFVLNQAGGLQVLRNETANQGRSLRVAAVGGASNGTSEPGRTARDAIGTLLRLRTPQLPGTLAVEINRSTRGDGFQRMALPEGALGDLEVTWPSGVVQRRYDLQGVEVTQHDPLAPPVLEVHEAVVWGEFDSANWQSEIAGGSTLVLQLDMASTAIAATDVDVAVSISGPDGATYRTTFEESAADGDALELTVTGIPFAATEQAQVTITLSDESRMHEIRACVAAAGGSDDVCRPDGQYCEMDSDCIGGCVENTCAPLGSAGDDCDSDDDCAGSIRCTTDSALGVCGGTGAVCTDDVDCEITCIASRCADTVGLGETCDSKEDCSGPNVNCTTTGGADVCGGQGAVCVADSDCDSDSYSCIGGFCATFSTLNDSCDTDADCDGDINCNGTVCGGAGALCAASDQCVNSCAAPTCE